MTRVASLPRPCGASRTRCCCSTRSRRRTRTFSTSCFRSSRTGGWTDAQGRTVDFRNSIVIMTSNIGAKDIARNTPLGFSVSDETGISYEEMKERIMGELKKVFRPEFLNRIDEVIVFHKLTKDEIKEIIELMVGRAGPGRRARAAARSIRGREGVPRRRRLRSGDGCAAAAARDPALRRGPARRRGPAPRRDHPEHDRADRARSGRRRGAAAEAEARQASQAPEEEARSPSESARSRATRGGSDDATPDDKPPRRRRPPSQARTTGPPESSRRACSSERLA